MMRISQVSSERVRMLAFVLALLVVPIHASGLSGEWMRGEVSVSVGVLVFNLLGSDTISRLAVPFFFVVSGFFLVNGLEREGLRRWWGRALVKRSGTLLIPYLAWNLFYFVFKLATGKYGFEWKLASDQLVGWNLFNVPACGQFWYVRCLLIYVIVAPLLVFLMRNLWLGAAILVIDCVCWFAGVKLFPFYIQPADLGYLLYFCGGLWLGLHLERVRSVLAFCQQKLRGSFAVVFAVGVMGVVWFSVTRNAELAGLANKVMILFGLATLWFYSDELMRMFGRWRSLFGLSFFIYAFHVILVSVAYKVLSHTLPMEPYQSVGYVLKIAFAMLGSLGVGVTLRRFMPRMYSVLCGGR